MGTGYTRNDTANNIADGNVINASDLDGEFDAIQAAFNATTGHSHDGTTGEGPQIGTGGIADNAVTLGTKTTGNYVATGAVSGVGLSGSASAEGATFTVTSNATDANTASTIVARDASGNFSAGTITASLTGTASNAALLDSLDSTQFLRSDAADTKTSGDLSFSDNVKAVFGAGSDLEIYHDSNNSFINDVGTGNLRIGADTNVSITNSTNSTNYAVFNDASAVKLYYGGVKKFETTSSGITVEGSTAPTINIKSTDTVVVANDVVGAITFEESDATGGTGVQAFIKAIANDSGSTYDMSIGVGGNTEAIRIDQSGSVGIGTSSPNTPQAVNLHISGTSSAIRMSDTTNSLTGNLYASGGEFSILTSSSHPLVFKTSNSEAMRIDSSGNVGIGTGSPASSVSSSQAGLHIADTNVAYLSLDNTNASGHKYTVFSDDAGNLRIYDVDAASYRMMIDDSGNVGIGATTIDAKMHIEVASGDADLKLEDGSGTYMRIDQNSIGGTSVIRFNTGASLAERARIDSSGNLLVGKTSASVANDGIQLEASGTLGVTRANDDVAIFNRKSSDGNIAVFRKDNTTVGSIGTNSSRTYIGSGSGQSGIKFNTGAIVPVAGADGANSDASYSLGISSARFTNAYFSATVFAAGVGGVSDENTYVNFPGSDVMQFYTGGSERARLDASGNLLVGTTDTSPWNNTSGTGILASSGGVLAATSSGDAAFYGNRLGSDGDIIQLRKSGTTVGSIGVDSGDNLYLTGESGNTGGIYMNDAAVSPAYQGSERDAYYDLGKGAARWKDLHLSGQANVGTAVAATQSASVTGSTTLDFSTYQNFILTMTGNITLAQPSTEQAGQSGFIIFIHSGAARTVSLGADYETAGAAGLTLSGASGAVDLVPYVVQSSGNILLGAPQLAFA